MTLLNLPPRRSYPSDLIDDEWSLLAELIPTSVWLPNLQEHNTALAKFILTQVSPLCGHLTLGVAA